jgi:hypothetical protein
MAYDKRIVTHDEFTIFNGYVLSTNLYRHDIAYMIQLATEAKCDFPFLKVEEIEVFVVTKSEYNKGFWGVKFPLPAGTTKEGYRSVKSLDFFHS